MMNLEKINSFAKFYEAGNTTLSRTTGSYFQGMSGLDEAEKSMINKAFPESNNHSLNVYQSNGQSRTEKPDARGNHVDFTI